MTTKNYYDDDIIAGDDVNATQFMNFVDNAIEDDGHQHSGNTRDGNSVLKPTDVWQFKLTRDSDYAGSDFSGSDGDANRTVTIANTREVQTSMVFYDGRILASSEYSISSATPALLTIVKNLFDEQNIVVIYTQ